jgi:hypothetical protein
MAFKLKNFKKREVDPFVSFDGVEVDVYSLPDQSVTLEQYKTVRANTDGFNLLYTKLNNEALKHAVKNTLANCNRPNEITYDGNLQHNLVPELLKRLP